MGTASGALHGRGPIPASVSPLSAEGGAAVRVAAMAENRGRRPAGAGGAARAYPSVEAAIRARVMTAQRSPGGRQYLSREAADAMVRRATVPATPATSSPPLGLSSSVVFRHDPRLQWPSMQYYTREQVRQLYRDVSCPVCLLLAEDGWPFDHRTNDDILELLRPEVRKTLPGSHHFHADPSTAAAVVLEVVHFLGEKSRVGVDCAIHHIGPI